MMAMMLADLGQYMTDAERHAERLENFWNSNLCLIGGVCLGLGLLGLVIRSAIRGARPKQVRRKYRRVSNEPFEVIDD